jgi:hypothetical protein
MLQAFRLIILMMQSAQQAFPSYPSQEHRHANERDPAHGDPPTAETPTNYGDCDNDHGNIFQHILLP